MKKSVTTPPMVDGTSLRTGPLALLYSTVRLWRDVRSESQLLLSSYSIELN